MTEQTRPTVVAVTESMTPVWGMSSLERLRRITAAAKLGWGEEAAAGPKLLVDPRYAFDPPLLHHLARNPGSVLLRDRVPVMAHVGEAQAGPVAEAMRDGMPLPEGLGLDPIHYSQGFTLYNDQLRKRERPFLIPLVPENVRAIERASYFAAYKGVTDLLTKYLWPEWALWLTRGAARAGITPNMVTAVGAFFCLVAMWLFWLGHYWAGMAAGLFFMVLDTVDGKLARCTITSSKWGNVFDHGIDLVHPPFWWCAWAVGLSAWGLGYTPDKFAWIMAAIVGGYIVQRLIEGAFMRLYGMHIHVWERIDSRFRLITARRNPNMVILFVAMLFARPDIGLEAVAWWTILSCIFHAVRLAQAMLAKALGGEVRSWLG